jgi:hypothetical protein
MLCCRHLLLTELRVLLVHGLLHLVGFDHEQGEQQLQVMAQQEAALLSELGWEGSGLISLASQELSTSTTAVLEPSSSSGSSSAGSVLSDDSDADSVCSLSSSKLAGSSRYVVFGARGSAHS